MIIPSQLVFTGVEFSVEMLGATSYDNQAATVWVKLTVTRVLEEDAYVVASKGEPARARVGDEYTYQYEAAAVRAPDARNEGP